ncbi:hypothetical protein F2Q69_00062071 [Brassica cretica]|uniref:Uncharacterized protein n=1 Tax=Brassica cretica TaxID=69181 RepID=A0A8S9RPV8_BRACR|nr:hypothetical protein F2Q69_00062071 [Brassica cretica]
MVDLIRAKNAESIWAWLFSRLAVGRRDENASGGEREGGETGKPAKVYARDIGFVVRQERRKGGGEKRGDQRTLDLNALLGDILGGRLAGCCWLPRCQSAHESSVPHLVVRTSSWGSSGERQHVTAVVTSSVLCSPALGEDEE